MTYGTPKIVKLGNKVMTITDLTFDSSYPTNGESLTVKQLGLTLADVVWAPPVSGYTFEFDATNSKIKAYTTAGTEVTDTTNLSSIVAKVMAIGV